MTMQKIFGSKADLRESFLVALAMLAVTVVYESAMLMLVPDFAIHWYEFFGTWFILNAVWLVRTQNIQTWWWGIAGVLALGVFFRDIGLPGQQWLQWAYFLPIQIWSWYYWVSGAKDNESLPVTFLSNTGRLFWVAIMAAGALIVYYSIDVFAPGSLYPGLDAVVVIASITAQFLMGRKNVESWVLWLGPVNVISIVLFYLAGAYVLTALYLAFFVHAVFGVRSWYKAAQNKDEVIKDSAYA